jgi:hypothetical protein
MREAYVPLFQDIRSSSLWALDSDVRMVWITLLTMVDPEGYVCAAIPGLAVAANVPVGKVREAIAIFEAPDPDSRSTEHDGRRLQKVPRGWLVLNYGAIRRRAAHEAEKARKRRWANKQRAANDAEEPAGGVSAFGLAVDPDEALGVGRDDDWTRRSEPVDASKSKSKSGSDHLVVAERRVVKDLAGWEPSAQLRADAAIAGVPDFDERIRDLRLGPIGGARGVFAVELDDYIRSLFPKWKNWRETAAFKQQTADLKRARGPRIPIGLDLITRKHEAYAKRHGLDLTGFVRDVIEEDLPEKVGLGRAREILGERMARAARSAGKGAA